MMERKRALTIQFARGKDKIMENPLRLPTSYLECGKIQQQIPWTAIAGHKSRRRDSKRTNGAVLFDHNHEAMVRLGLALRKPCLILTDVLKTDAGKAYMEKIKQHVNGKESGRVKVLPMVSKDRRSSQRKSTNSKSKSVSPKRKQTPDLSYNRATSRSAKKAPTQKEESNLDSNEEVGSVKNEFELVDCGLSVMWEQENHGKSPATEIKKTKPKKAQKRKANDIVSESTETDSPKRPRASVLRLSGVVDMEGEATIYTEKETEDKDLKNTDGGIVQFTVGEGDKSAEPINSTSVDNGAATTAITEPIVLSSDDEDSDEKIVSQKLLSQKPLSPQQKPELVEDLQVFQVLVNENTDSVKDTCLCLAFSDLYCGPYRAMANGDLLITDENIIIPLKNVSEEMDLIVTLERKQLRRYSVWNKAEMESLKYFSDRNASEIPAAGLLCCVSEDAAEGVQYDLVELCDKPENPRTTEMPSPFIVIFLQDSLEGMEGAFLRSLLDMDCLNSLTQRKTLRDFDQEIVGPGLSLDQSVELIKSSGLDEHLLQLLDQGSDCTGADYGHESTSYGHESTSNCDLKLPKETVLKLGKTSENEQSSQVEEAAQPKETPHLSAEKNAFEPVYTLCHRQLEDSYSVTMCKPDSSWVKYKHRGLARRLIQFPPPPMKGGITVTMEDLQCLDIGQYLNDVIIDFYLKYLLQNAPESVAKRVHIFSSFFYKQLTRRDNASEGSNSESCQRQKRYQRVRTWTRHVDIFSKDFIFVPVNQEAHWYLVVICFPGLEEPQTETFSQGQDEAPASESPNENAPNKCDSTDTEKDTTNDPVLSSVTCTEQTCRRKTVCKRPCILVMDSLKRSPHERVFKLMREYLQSEWEARRGSSRDFGQDQMESSHCNVPLQDNSSDCGLYLLHYVESFLKDPIVHFDLPLHLKFWFPRHQVRRKREEIRDLVLKLYRIQNMYVKT